ncbi:uncharacterized protein [Rutidosis leptorrhynchoides]|uniref:uncharacterized protein n=1 Tax=Rutidosis leptorrhynchoides TaxID=125765 RepID=UPI003A98EEA3
MIKQKSRAKWVVDGDENTKFFHSYIRRRESKRNIRGLVIDGVWNESPIDVKDDAFIHFEKQFKRMDSNRLQFVNATDQPCVNTITAAESDALEVPFTEKEVWVAVNECGCSKSSGLDGFKFKFFKLHWELIKGDLLKPLSWF